jgi:hypothetical protein
MFTRNIGSMSADPGAIFGPIQGLTEEVAIADSRPSLARGGADHLGACDGELQLACPSSCGRSLRMADPRMPNELRTFASANLSAPFREVTFCANYKCHSLGRNLTAFPWLLI